MSPFCAVPKIPERVQREHSEMYEPGKTHDYRDGWMDAVRQILGQDSWFACLCELDGNPLPKLIVE